MKCSRLFLSIFLFLIPTSYSLSGLGSGIEFYLALTVFDTDGNESWYSNEVHVTPQNTPPESFILLYPPADTIMIRPGYTIADTVKFVWSKATDIDMDMVQYFFTDVSDGWLFSDYSTTDTVLFLTPEIAFTEKATDRAQTFTINWNITAYDGVDSTSSINGPLTFVMINSSLGIANEGLVPEKFALHQNYPNPFNPSTRIEFDLPSQTQIRLIVYDIMGRQVSTILKESMVPGYHRIVWNGRDRRGLQVPSGIYIARLVTEEYSKSIKMVLMK